MKNPIFLGVIAFIGIASAITIYITFKIPKTLAASTPSNHTVQWFLENPTVLKTDYIACQNDPGGIGKTSECANAENAAAQQANINAWKSPPPSSVSMPNPFPNATSSSTSGSKPGNPP